MTISAELLFGAIAAILAAVATAIATLWRVHNKQLNALVQDLTRRNEQLQVSRDDLNEKRLKQATSTATQTLQVLSANTDALREFSATIASQHGSDHK